MASKSIEVCDLECSGRLRDAREREPPIHAELMRNDGKPQRPGYASRATACD